MADASDERLRECAASDCSVVFVLARHPNGGWTRKRFCSARCQGREKRRKPDYQEAERRRNRRRQMYITRRGREVRERNRDWGSWWEAQRRREDRADLNRKADSGPCCRLRQRPRPRHFLGGYCSECDVPFVAWDKKGNYSSRCSRCTKARWRETHYARAARHGARFDVVDPRLIFERDGWRCQLCGRKTVAEWGSKRSATLDHIVPMACGGDHVRENLQCACWSCNSRKGHRAANDQLILIG